jgi:hypothetical protein
MRYCITAAQALNPDCPAEEELRRGLEVGGGCSSLGPYAVHQCVCARHSDPLFRLCSPHAQDEWERDRQGMPALTGPLFFDAVFEMIGRCPACGPDGAGPLWETWCRSWLVPARPMDLLRGRPGLPRPLPCHSQPGGGGRSARALGHGR